jgi:hypothetical protein
VLGRGYHSNSDNDTWDFQVEYYTHSSKAEPYSGIQADAAKLWQEKQASHARLIEQFEKGTGWHHVHEPYWEPVAYQ